MSDLEQLEKMVDRESVSYVLHVLAQICESKATHIEEVWQDESLAKTWDTVTLEIEKLAGKLILKDF